MNASPPSILTEPRPAATIGTGAGSTIGDTGRAMRTSAVTSRRLVETSLADIAQLNPVLNCFVSVDAPSALAVAEERDDELRAGRDRGPLHGIPVAIKDIIDVAGAVTTSGSAVFTGRVAVADAACVARLREAGAVVIGKTVLHEFAYGITGDRSAQGASRNPHDPTRMSGGSSGGSAVAVAAGIVPFAIGTDTAGSVRVPAALCGVVGFKPAYEALDITGVHPLSPSLDHLGFFTRSVGDAAVVYDILARGSRAPDRTDARPTLGWVTLPGIRVEPAIESAVLDGLMRCGFETADVRFDDAASLFSILTNIQSREAYLAHAEDLEHGAALIDEEVRGRLLAGAKVSTPAYENALHLRDVFRRKVVGLFESYDLLVLPTVPMVAPRIGERSPVVAGWQVEVRAALLSLTSPWNLSGMPAISISAGKIDGLPFGLQVVSAPGREAVLFDVATRIERGLRSPRTN